MTSGGVYTSVGTHPKKERVTTTGGCAGGYCWRGVSIRIKYKEQLMEGTQEHIATWRPEQRKGKETLLGDLEDRMAIRRADKGKCKAATTRQSTTRQRLPPATPRDLSEMMQG